MATKQVPLDGLWVWEQPDPASSPSDQLAAGVTVEVLETADFGWARVRWGDGRQGWVDGQQLIEPGPPTATAAAGNQKSRLYIIVGAVLVAVIAVGVVVATRGDDSGNGSVVGTGDDATATSGDGGSDSGNESGTSGSTGSAEDDNESPASGTDGAFFDDEWAETAMAAALANPPPAGAQRDQIATARMLADLEGNGFDLGNLEVAVYSSTPDTSFVLLGSNDSTALLEADGQGDAFMESLLASSAFELTDITQLVLQHTGVDDEGPFVMTFVVPVADLRNSIATGADISESLSVQIERDQ